MALTQVHVSFWAKTVGFSALQYNAEVRALLPTAGGGGRGGRVSARMGRRLSWWSLSLAADQDWTHFEYVCSSWDGSPDVALYLGVEDRGNVTGHPAQQGSLFFDDVTVSTTARACSGFELAPLDACC